MCLNLQNHKKLFFLTFFFAFVLSSCVNKLNDIQKVTYDKTAPDEVSKDLHVYYTDSGYAKIEIFSKLAETYRVPEYVTKLKDGLKVNFFTEDGQIVSTLTALYGEINFTKNIMFVKDSVRLINHAKQQTMETEMLFWNQKDSVVYTNNNVVVNSPNGVLYGQGIKTKQDFTSYEFLKPYGKFNLKE